jgi:DNA polymerase delta subunit 1
MGSSEQKSLRSREKKYAGAFVLDPTPGYYTKYVATLDFASLYPSIAIAFNLCWSTFLQHRYDRLTGQIWFPYFDRSATDRSTDKYCLWYAEDAPPTPQVVGKRVLILVYTEDKTGLTCCFVQNVPSLFPGMLKSLLALRKTVKKELKIAEDNHDDFQCAVLDSRQAAVKVLANAGYGFCGATAGFFGCIPIAITICGMGRHKIMFTKATVETKFGGRIIYGDTDSVFIVFDHLENQPHKTREEILEDVVKTSIEACTTITKALPPPMALEFEKYVSRCSYVI